VVVKRGVMLKIDKIPARYIQFGLGDRWAAISCLLRESEEKNRPIFVNCDFDERHLQELVSFFNTTGCLEFDKTRKIIPCDYRKAFLTKYLPTKSVWRDTDSKIVAYQFDGRSSFWHKNPSMNEVNEFISYIHSIGLIPVNLGNHKPLSHIIEVLSTCKLFVGCASGIGHISMSVNAPMCIILQNMPENDEPPYGSGYLKKVVYSSKTDVRFFKYLNDLIIHLSE